MHHDARTAGPPRARGRAGADREGAARSRAARPRVPPPAHRRGHRAGHRRDAARLLARREARRCAVLPAHAGGRRDLDRSAACCPGPLHLGYIPFRGTLRRPIVTPIVIGLAAAAIFLLGAPGRARDPAAARLRGERAGPCTQGEPARSSRSSRSVNGAAEEVFFRGALFAAIGRKHPVLISTGVYALATVATGNPMLVFAALTLGVVLACSGGHRAEFSGRCSPT